jgi:hypothetical protein
LVGFNPDFHPHLAILHGGNLDLLGAREAAGLPLLRAAEVFHLSKGASEAWRHVGGLRNQVVSSVGMGVFFKEDTGWFLAPIGEFSEFSLLILGIWQNFVSTFQADQTR